MKPDFSHIDFKSGLNQIPIAFKILLGTPAFIKKHQLWKGFLDHSWVFVFSIVIACFFSYNLYNSIQHYFFPQPDNSSEVDISIDANVGIDEGIKAIDDAMATVSEEAKADLASGKESIGEVKEMLEGKHQPLFSGSLKFLLLILLEVLIYHFAVRTNNILKNKNKLLDLKEFYKAQIRMIKVMARKWVYGLLMYILVSIICGITGTLYLRDVIMFMIYGFYLGFAFLDNYLEQFGFSIKDSAKTIQTHFGASTVFGLFASVMMNIPIVGPLLIPFVCGIAATRYGHAVRMESIAQ